MSRSDNALNYVSWEADKHFRNQNRKIISNETNSDKKSESDHAISNEGGNINFFKSKEHNTCEIKFSNCNKCNCCFALEKKIENLENLLKKYKSLFDSTAKKMHELNEIAVTYEHETQINGTVRTLENMIIPEIKIENF